MNLTFAPCFIYFEIIINSQEVARKCTGGLGCLSLISLQWYQSFIIIVQCHNQETDDLFRFHRFYMHSFMCVYVWLCVCVCEYSSVQNLYHVAL